MPPTRSPSAPALSPFCALEPAGVGDRITALIVHLGYHAVSILTGDSRPAKLFSTFMSSKRKAFDGVFVLTTKQTDQVIAKSTALSQQIALAKKLLVHAFTPATDTRSSTGRESSLIAWAKSISTRLEQRLANVTGLATEDVSTLDYAGALDDPDRGEWVQISPAEGLATYISFGGLRYHFEGTVTMQTLAHGQSSVVQLDLCPVLVDTFDFHFKQEDAGTGWMDHALARLQCSGEAKPFRIEGTGSPFKLTVSGAPSR